MLSRNILCAILIFIFVAMVVSIANPIANPTPNDKVILFYAPWCGHCNEMKPLMESVSETMQIPITYIDGDHDPQELIRYGIKSYPTLIVDRGGSERDSCEPLEVAYPVPLDPSRLSIYEGPRVKHEITRFLKTNYT